MSEEIKKITEEELTRIQENQSNMATLISQIGALEAQKQDVLNQVPEVKKTMESLKQELEKAYGPININVSDGTYTEIPVENLKKVD